MKKKPPFNMNAAIRGAIRRTFARSPKVREVLEASRREVPRYKKDGTRAKKNFVHRQCQVCNNWVSSSKIAIDHIEPVISTEDGFVDWNTFVERIDCDISNLQRICDNCHDKKTNKERIARLLKQYTEELDKIEKDINNYLESECADNHNGFYKKLLSKYTAKKKTKGLESVVQRAQVLKNKL